jgi:hypothetical protein
MNSNNNYPRLLIVSHNPFSLINNGKTFTALFKGWPKDNIAQLYLSTDVPDFSVCHKFFQLHDIDILRRALFNRRVRGRRITYSDLPQMIAFRHTITTDHFLQLLRGHVDPFSLIARDLLWNIAGYKTRELQRFIDEFDPHVVYFQSYKSVFAFSIAKWLCKSKSIPLIIGITDDQVSGKFTLDPFFWIQLTRVKRAFKSLILSSDVLCGGCIALGGDRMAEEYKSRFGGNYIVAMNAIAEPDLPNHTPINGLVKFMYAGCLGLSRWKVLALIAECLEELYRDEDIHGELSIYSFDQPRAKASALLNTPHCCSFNGVLNADQLSTAKAHSDVLVHVESFDKKNKHITRLSMSTKIPEYLASRRCIFAVGPGDVASMQYLVDYDLGITVVSDNKATIKEALKKIIRDAEMRSMYANKGVELAKLRHNADKTAESVFQMISAAVNMTDCKRD